MYIEISYLKMVRDDVQPNLIKRRKMNTKKILTVICWLSLLISIILVISDFDDKIDLTILFIILLIGLAPGAVQALWRQKDKRYTGLLPVISLIVAFLLIIGYITIIL